MLANILAAGRGVRLCCVLALGVALCLQRSVAQPLDNLSPQDPGADEQTAFYEDGEQIYSDILGLAIDTGIYNQDDCASSPCLNGGTCRDGSIIAATIEGQDTLFN
eukprot:SAG11_NODE_17088_length_529_cov_0.600000_1_plen_105_part_01